jgi:hypothetical protein
MLRIELAGQPVKSEHKERRRRMLNSRSKTAVE